MWLIGVKTLCLLLAHLTVNVLGQSLFGEQPSNLMEQVMHVMKDPTEPQLSFMADTFLPGVGLGHNPNAIAHNNPKFSFLKEPNIFAASVVNSSREAGKRKHAPYATEDTEEDDPYYDDDLKPNATSATAGAAAYDPTATTANPLITTLHSLTTTLSADATTPDPLGATESPLTATTDASASASSKDAWSQFDKKTWSPSPKKTWAPAPRKHLTPMAEKALTPSARKALALTRKPLPPLVRNPKARTGPSSPSKSARARVAASRPWLLSTNKTGIAATAGSVTPLAAAASADPLATAASADSLATAASAGSLGTAASTDSLATAASANPFATAASADPLAAGASTGPLAAGASAGSLAAAASTDPLATAASANPLATAATNTIHPQLVPPTDAATGDTSAVASASTETDMANYSEPTSLDEFLLVTVCKKVNYCQARVQSASASNDIAAAIHDLSAKLIKILARDHTNVIISPLSIAATLVMTYRVSGGNTRKQINEVLGISKNKLQDVFYHPLQNLNKNGNDYTSMLAHRMFLQKRYAYNRKLYSKVKEDDGSLKVVDFSRDSQSAIAKINSWAAKYSKNEIKELFHEPLDPAPQMVLASLAYFKGSWKIPFPPEMIQMQDFYLPDGRITKATMMVLLNKRFRYFNDTATRCQYLELPYLNQFKKDDHNISLLIALPQKERQPIEVEMTADLLCYVLDHLNKTMLLKQVAMPKFHLSQQTHLRGPLVELGMTDLFDAHRAILPDVSREHRFACDAFVHNAVLQVDEGMENNIQPTEEETVTSILSFVADRPFHVFVIDRDRQIMILSGKVSDPSHYY